jgi:hypothetical protein
VSGENGGLRSRKSVDHHDVALLVASRQRHAVGIATRINKTHVVVLIRQQRCFANAKRNARLNGFEMMISTLVRNCARYSADADGASRSNARSTTL